MQRSCRSSIRIPAYHADANTRLSTVIGRNVRFLSWVNHLQDAYFQQKSILQWTLEEDLAKPGSYPNSYKNPVAQIALDVPSGRRDDADRGPGSRRHKPWTTGGGKNREFEWVPLESSLQWAALRRTIDLLRSRHNNVFVLVAPFNEHMIADPSRPGYNSIRTSILAWLDENQVPHVTDTLPSELYADASHPLTAGYELLARRIMQDETFRAWMRY